MESIENDIIEYSKKGDIVLCGDLNARTNSENDFISNDEKDNTPLFEDYVPDSYIKTRVSQDRVLCDRGKQLIDMCIAYKLRIANGRALGDSMGKFTCYKYNGNSVVDYCLLSENLYTDILSFKVEDIIPRLSDHSVISLRIVASFRPVTSDIKIKDFPRQFVWNPESDIHF